MGRRFFLHGELPLMLLLFLDERPMHTYDLMTELGRAFAPHYSPSPGSIYPAVDALEAEGLIARADDGPRTTYRITRTGRDALEKRRDVLAAIELRTGVRLTQRNQTEAALQRFSAQIREVATGADAAQLEGLLESAFQTIRSQLQKTSSRETEVTPT